MWPNTPREPNSGQFRPGHGGVASKRKAPGDTYVDKVSGDTFVAVAQRHTYFPHRRHEFRPRRLIVREAAHGPAPPGCIVLRLGRDREDDRLQNLVLVRRVTSLLLNSGRWSRARLRWNDLPDDPEIRLMAVAPAALKAGPPYICLPGDVEAGNVDRTG